MLAWGGPALAGEQAFFWKVDYDGLECLACPEFMPEGCRLAVLQGDPGEHNADVFFKLPGGTTVPHHWHTSAERMVLIAGELHVDFEGQDPIVMKSGTYAYGPAKLPHVAECKPGHGHRFVRVALRSVLSAPKPSAAEPRARKGVCGKDAGPKPTGTSSRRPLRPEVGCPKGKRNQTAETMTNAANPVTRASSLSHSKNLWMPYLWKPIPTDG